MVVSVSTAMGACMGGSSCAQRSVAIRRLRTWSSIFGDPCAFKAYCGTLSSTRATRWPTSLCSYV
eukprot:8448335-Pyramimonas_sp.AAC.1